MQGISSKETERLLAEARTSRERIFGEVENLRARGQVDGAGEDHAERLGNLNRQLASADDRIAELREEYDRAVYLERLASDPRNIDEGTPPASEQRGVPRVQTNEVRDWTSRYVTAVGNEHYRSAFAKLVADPQFGHLSYDTAEVEAVRAAKAVDAERSMAIGAGASGGFLLPFQLDPTVMLSSAGALNPIRQIARVETVSANQHGRDPQVGSKPLGIPAVLREDDIGAYYEVPLLDTTYNRDLIPGLEAGVYGASFRFRVTRETFDQRPPASAYNSSALPERTIQEARVLELGPVTFPAYVGATAGVRSLTDYFVQTP